MPDNILAKQSARLHDLIQEKWDLAHLQLGVDSQFELNKHPFSDIGEHEISHPDEHLLSLLMNPDYFGWTCSKIFNTAVNDDGLELLPMQCALLREMWNRPFPMLVGSRGLGKSFLLALYAVLRALFIQGRKIVITGAGFRQSKIVFSYAELLWYNSPILRDLCGASHSKSQGPHHDTDMWWMQIGESVIKALPLGTGDKIRGQRAHDIIVDEFASVPQQIFEEVVAGFGVVNLDPIAQVKHFQRLEYIKEIGDGQDLLMEKEAEDTGLMGNQIILSGTASFAFNHFYRYWKKQRDIIRSQGDKHKLQSLGIDPTLNYKNYSIIRIPVDLLPKGFMSEATVQRSRATISVGIYENEFGAVFSDDSSGFYRRSALEKATPSIRNPVVLPSGETLMGFHARLAGEKGVSYVMGVDPAAQKDKFAIVILENHEDHARIVYCWTTDAQDHLEKRNKGHVQEKDYFAYTTRKIRDLMKIFNIVHVAIDSQGGGRQIYEALHNDRYLQPGEQLLWELAEGNALWDGKDRPTDDEVGLHIVELCNFRDNKYIVDANMGMKHDFEQRQLLFPYFDAIEVVLAGKDDYDHGRSFDTLDDVVTEIDEIKNELQTIIHDATAGGMERWILPKVKDTVEGQRLYDDRYAALLMANSAARRLRQIPRQGMGELVPGGFVGRFQSEGSPKNTQLYVGPSWFTEKVKESSASYGMVVKR